MIIECKGCHKKFTVNDSEISINGRTVQCSNCSTQWLQMPIAPSITTENMDVDDVDQEPSKNKFKASDGKNYKFLGNQWAEVLSSGKAGKLARKKISKELNILAGKTQIKRKNIINKSNQSTNQYLETEGGGMGIFSFLIVLVISVCAIILVLDTFKNQLIPLFPDLDNYLLYIFETLNNIYIITKDFFNNYK